MTIKSTDMGPYILNELDDRCNLDEVYRYISNDYEPCTKKHLIWDLLSFNFEGVTYFTFSNFMDSVASFTKKRKGLKTAYVVHSDQSFMFIKILELIAKCKTKIIIRVFRSKEDAVSWVCND